MLTPVFYCTQDESFVIVAITLSALCKAMGASFNIIEQQFTFHCSPYYLRLKFDQRITEGKGERATYDVAACVLTVYLPKETKGEVFTQLDNPAYLIATDRERQKLVELVSNAGGTLSPKGVGRSDNEEEEVENDEGPDTEFVQKLRLPCVGESPADGCGDYGFAGSFQGTFALLDADVVREIIDLPSNPDETTAAMRRQLRLEAEQRDFDEDALFFSLEDEEGEVERLLQYVPHHRQSYLAALEAEGIRCVRRSGAAVSADSVTTTGATTLPRSRDTLEEEEVVLPQSVGVVNIWSGNVALSTETTFRPSNVCTLAVPQKRPQAEITQEEQAILQRIVSPKLLFPPHLSTVYALTIDLLCAEGYDDLVTEGTGCSESLWNICKMSPALSWLDTPDNVYDACVAFARRVLVYPLHRSIALVHRVLASVGIRLLMGKSYVIKALLRVRDVLAHAEHRHVLVTLFLNPLIAYWLNLQDADNHLLELALELHSHATRSESETDEGVSSLYRSPLLIVQERRQLHPIQLNHLGLPF
uniref:Uncharacterized protein n=1 Tax=Trypanosoma vivax (strain Y486) TaxID=1055687 RepID=G0U9F9_TRYVY|nr:conserved hypothetical protein, fragment [Trypanosoma vivax Y486]